MEDGNRQKYWSRSVPLSLLCDIQFLIYAFNLFFESSIAKGVISLCIYAIKELRSDQTLFIFYGFLLYASLLFRT